MDVGMAEAGQSCDEPLHREEEGRPHQDVLQRPGLWGSAPGRWDMDLDGQDATSASWTTSRACGSVLGFLARVTGCWSPRRGNVLLIGWLSCPERANVSLRGLTPSFSAHFGILACKSDK
jgi:hypothetical protein